MKTDKKEKRQIKKENIIMAAVIVTGLALLAVGLWFLAKVGDTPSKKVVFKVGDEKVYQDEVNLCILQNVVALGIDSEALEMEPKEGGTADEFYKKEILQVIMDYKVEAKVAKARGIALSEEEMKAVKNDAVGYMDKVNGRILKYPGITQERIVEIYEERYLANLLEKTVTEDIEVEEQRFCTMYMMLFPKVETDETGDYVKQEDGETPVMLSEEEIAKMKENADAAHKELSEGADTATIAKKYGVEHVSGEEGNLVDNFGEPFSKYAESLKAGEISPVLDTASCYAILKMIDEDKAEMAEQIYKLYRADLEKEAISEERLSWYEEAGVGKEPKFVGTTWKKITLYDFIQYVED